MMRALFEKVRQRFAQRKLRQDAAMRSSGMDDELVRLRRRTEEQIRVLEALEAEGRVGPHQHSRRDDV